MIPEIGPTQIQWPKMEDSLPFSVTLSEDITPPLSPVMQQEVDEMDDPSAKRRKFNQDIGKIVSGQLPTWTIPHHTIGPNGWFYWLVVVLVGSCHSGHWGGVLGIMVLVGGSWALFFPNGAFS